MSAWGDLLGAALFFLGWRPADGTKYEALAEQRFARHE